MQWLLIRHERNFTFSVFYFNLPSQYTKIDEYNPFRNRANPLSGLNRDIYLLVDNVLPG